MRFLAGLASIALILIVLVDAFEAIVLPRRVNRRFRPTQLFYRYTWRPWAAVARRLRPGRRRETYISLFGPLSMLLLLGLWAVGLVTAFGLLHWALRSPLQAPEQPGLFTYVYLSGVSFTTLGFGDVTPVNTAGRVLATVEAGLGFGFLAIVIGYLPVLHQAFSQREAAIALLDARAGSPPSAGQLLTRLAQAQAMDHLASVLGDWERWCGVLLESHLSFPVVTYYRSQHDNQSWLAAITAILDTCALTISCLRDVNPYQAQMTFAMARHAVVDLALVFRTPPRPLENDRLPPETFWKFRELLEGAGVALHPQSAAAVKLGELRAMYEPFANALARYFLFALPPVIPQAALVDNWQTSAWMRRVAGIGNLGYRQDDHFD